MEKLPNLLRYPTLPNQMSAISPSDRTQEERTTHGKIINDNQKKRNKMLRSHSNKLKLCF